jgi:hypothetical protein
MGLQQAFSTLHCEAHSIRHFSLRGDDWQQKMPIRLFRAFLHKHLSLWSGRDTFKKLSRSVFRVFLLSIAMHFFFHLFSVKITKFSQDTSIYVQ